jgi:hypothetical protein
MKQGLKTSTLSFLNYKRASPSSGGLEMKLNRFTTFFVFFLLVFAQSGALLSASANGQAGSINLFSDGTSEITVPLTANQTDTNFSIEVPRNVTFESAQFYINVDHNDVSPGQVSLDINQDGIKEWAFEGVGFGDIGHQNTFSNDDTAEDIYSIGSASSMPMYVPHISTIQSAVASLTYTSEVNAGLRQMGQITTYESGDFDNDSREEIIVLSTVQSVTNSSAALSMLDWDPTTGVTSTSWTPTCSSSSSLSVADINGDNHSDVVSFVPTANLACVHLFNASSNTFGNASAVALSSGLISALAGDINGDGAADILSIHQNGIVSIREYDDRRNSFSDNATIIVDENGTSSPAQLVGLAGGYFDGNQGDFTAVVSDSSGYSNQLIWASGAVSLSGDTMDGLSDDIVLGDIDLDGDVDIFSPNFQGYTIAENTATGWATSSVLTNLVLENTTIADHDADGVVSLFVPQFGTLDGNAQTLDGNLTLYNITLSSISATTETLEPWTYPTDSMFIDMNSDGQMEHVVSAGEDTVRGLFIGTWESVGVDIDLDGQYDLTAEGYAGDNTSGTEPLMMIDDLGTMPTLLAIQSAGQSSQPMFYDIEMTPLVFDFTSVGHGTFNISSLDIGYDMDFIVEHNPAAQGNLTNVINQLQTAGAGTIVIDLPFVSSKNGSLYASNLNANYIPGAPNLALPTDPVLQLEMLTYDTVIFSWQDEIEFGGGFIGFEVFKVPSGNSFDLNNPTFSNEMNSTTDQDVSPGDSYDYVVRSLHLYGVTSNLSARLAVTIPYPAPPSAVQGMTVIDTPNDNGSSFDLAWNASLDAPSEYRVYVEPFEILTLENLTELTSTTTASGPGSFSMNLTTTSDGTPLVDRTDYWVAVVAYDEYGNTSEQFSSIGPVHTLNNSLRLSELTLNLSTSGHHDSTSFVMSALDSLDLTVTLTSEGETLPSQDLSLHIEAGDFAYSMQGVTDVNGVWYAVSVDDLTELSATFSDFIGAATITVEYAGTAGSESIQPADQSSLILSGMGALRASLTHSSEPVDLNETGSYSVEALITPELPSQSSILANVEYDWQLTNETGDIIDFGSVEVKGGKVSLSGTSDAHGLLSFAPSEGQDWFSVTPDTFSFSFAAHVSNETGNGTENQTTNQTDNQTGEPVFPDVTLAGTFSCQAATYAWEENGTDSPITCTITNPNPFAVQVGFTWKNIPTILPPISFEPSPLPSSGPVLTIPANGTLEVEFTPVRNGPSDGLFPGMQGVGYELSLTCFDDGTDNCTGMTSSSAATEGELQWTLSDPIIVPNSDNGDTSKDNSKGGSGALVGGIIAILVLAGVGIAFVLLRSRPEEDDDWFEAFDELDESEDSTPAPTPRSSRSLDEIRNSGDEFIAGEPPEERRRTLFDEVDGRGTVEDYDHEEGFESEDDTDEATEDDGISVDENGTEWWEDEEGVWWYREEGWEDWAVWEE